MTFEFSELRKCKAEDHPAFTQTLIIASKNIKEQWKLHDSDLDAVSIIANGTLNTESRKFTYVNVWLTTYVNVWRNMN